MKCADAPGGLRQKHRIHGSIGIASVISPVDGAAYYSKHSNFPPIDVGSLRGTQFSWPRRTDSDAQPTRGAKVFILGGHIGLLDDEIARNLRGRFVAREYPSCLVRRILRGAEIAPMLIYRLLNNAQVGGAAKPSPWRLLTSGTPPGNDAPCSRRGPSVRRVIGDIPECAIAVLGGMASLGGFMRGWYASPRITRPSPDWYDSLRDFIFSETRILRGRTGYRTVQNLEPPALAISGGRARFYGRRLALHSSSAYLQRPW